MHIVRAVHHDAVLLDQVRQRVRVREGVHHVDESARHGLAKPCGGHGHLGPSQIHRREERLALQVVRLHPVAVDQGEAPDRQPGTALQQRMAQPADADHQYGGPEG